MLQSIHMLNTLTSSSFRCLRRHHWFVYHVFAPAPAQPMPALPPRGRAAALRRAINEHNERRAGLGRAELLHADSAVVIQPAPTPAQATTTPTTSAPPPLRPRGRAGNLQHIAIRNLTNQPGQDPVEYLFRTTSRLFTGEPDYTHAPWNPPRSLNNATTQTTNLRPVNLSINANRNVADIRPAAIIRPNPRVPDEAAAPDPHVPDEAAAPTTITVPADRYIVAAFCMLCGLRDTVPRILAHSTETHGRETIAIAALNYVPGLSNYLPEFGQFHIAEELQGNLHLPWFNNGEEVEEAEHPDNRYNDAEDLWSLNEEETEEEPEHLSDNAEQPDGIVSILLLLFLHLMSTFY